MGNPDFEKRIVVITGASAGVGRAAALAFAAQGADLALLARDGASLEALADALTPSGVRVLTQAVDVGDADAVEAAAARVERELGPIDVWVNNAMVTVFGAVHQLSAAEFARVTQVTYLGYVHGTLAALKRMRGRDRGCIVQVGSALAHRAIPLQSAYCAAKHAIRGFTDALRCELIEARSAVRVTMVQMPALNTPQFDWAACHTAGAPRPVAPVFQPELAARAIVWAAAHRRREVWVGGSTTAVVLGNRIAPGLLDRYLGRTAGQAQQRDVAPADRVGNLWQSVAGRHRVHGAFGAEAKARSASFWLDTHRPLVAAAAVLGWLVWRTQR